jgi:hypothetical protein
MLAAGRAPAQREEGVLWWVQESRFRGKQRYWCRVMIRVVSARNLQPCELARRAKAMTKVFVYVSSLVFQVS